MIVEEINRYVQMLKGTEVKTNVQLVWFLISQIGNTQLGQAQTIMLERVFTKEETTTIAIHIDKEVVVIVCTAWDTIAGTQFQEV